MKKIYLMKTLLLLFALVAGSGSTWAAEEVYYTLDGNTATGNNSAPHNSYAAAADVTIDGIEWSVTANSSMAPWRIGGKSLDGVDRTVYSKTAMGAAITKVKLTVGDATDITVNSLKLIVASNADFSNNIDEVTATFSANSTITFTPTSGTEWITGAYYKFVFNVTVSASKNKFVEFTKAEFYHNAGPADTRTATTTTITASDGFVTELNGGSNVDAGTLTATVSVLSGTAPSSPAITWTSSDESVATVSAGAVTLKKSGTTTITATYEGDDDYKGSAGEYELTVTNSYDKGQINNPYTVAEALAASASTGVYVKGIVSVVASSSVTENGQIRYYISDDGTTTSHMNIYNGKGLNGNNFTSITDIQVGDEVVVFGDISKYNGNNQMNTDNYLVSLKRKPSPELSFGSTTSFTCDLYTEFDAPTLSYAEGFDGTVTYESSNESVANVNEDGEVTLVGVGETTITASSEATANFQAGTASYTLKVTKREGVDPVGSEGYYVKVTSINELEDGSQYLIVCEDGPVAFDGSLETLDVANNNISVTIKDNKIAATTATDAAQFTLASTDNGWTLKSASGYYIGQTTDANGLKASLTDEYENTITIDDEGNVNIVSGGAYLRYNSAVNNCRFRYFKSGTYTAQKAIQLYKYVAGESSMTVTLSNYGYKTLVATKNFTVSDATAYIVTATTTTSVTTQEISVVPANEPVFLKGTPSAEVTLNFTDFNADDVSNNLLEVSTATQGNGCYVLAALDGEVGFYMWAGGSLGAGRVILPADKVPSNARQFLPFNEATGIDEIVSSKPTNGEWYDLQGRRVVKAQKGLYIMNGKKVLVK